MDAKKKTLLVVDDDPNILTALQVRLRSHGFNVVTAPDGASALALVEVCRPDLVISDVWMPAGAGFSLAYRMKQCMPEVPIIFLTASKKPELKKMAYQLGADAFLEKPYEPDDLLGAIAFALKLPEFAICENDSLSPAN